MDCSSCAAQFAATQVTQISESTGSFAVEAFALEKAQVANESAVLPLLQKLPDLGLYSAHGSSGTPSSSGTQLNLRG